MSRDNGFIERINRFTATPWSVPIIAAALVFSVYLNTLAPTVTGEDSGELIAAAYVLGIPHPPGYPLWCVIAHLFTWIPVGEVAWRVNLMSAVFGAATVLLVARFAQHLTGKCLAGLVAGLALGFSREFWEQSIIAEVYTLNSFLMMLCIWLLWRWRETRETWRLWVFAVVYGLSLGNHNTMLVIGPFFALFILLNESMTVRIVLRNVCLALLALLSAVAIYAYLPIRSLADPAVDWGNPETLANWWRHIRREQYAFMFTEGPRSVERFAWQLSVMWRMWLREFTPWLGVLGLFGVLLFVLRERLRGLWLFAALLTPVLAAVYMQNFSNTQEWLWVMSVFLLPSSLLTALGLGAFLGFVSTRQHRWIRQTSVFIATLILATAYFAGRAAQTEHGTIVRDYCDELLDRLPEDAIFVPHADHLAFVTVYLQEVEGRHTGILLLRKYGYLDTEAMPELLEAFGAFPRRRNEQAIISHILTHSNRPVYVQEPYTPAADQALRSIGIARVARVGHELPHNPEPFHPSDFRIALEGDKARPDLTQRMIFLEQAMESARFELLKSRPEDAIRILDDALQVYGPDAIAANAVGIVLARQTRYDLAIPYFKRALEIDPIMDGARENLERAESLAAAADPAFME